MLKTILTIAGVIILVQIVWLLSYFRMKRRRKQYVRTKFGTPPKDREWNDNVKIYYEELQEEKDVDDITWNDLSMNQLFQYINCCDSSPGEEILFDKLRKNHMGQEERQRFENRVNTFGENVKERENVEFLLCDIGKSGASYYIPFYINHIDDYMLSYVWAFRFLRFLPIITFFMMAFSRNEISVAVFLAACWTNVMIYYIVKMKFEVEFSMLGTAVSIIRNAEKLSSRKEIAKLFPELKGKTEKVRKAMRGAAVMETFGRSADTGDLLGIFLDYILGIFLWQIATYDRVMRRLREDPESYLDVYKCIGEIDVAVCIASFRKRSGTYCIPEFFNERRIIMEGLIHPLVRDAVPNDLELRKSCIITGSNASGKSTFIKAAAVNAILAQSLNTCTAERFVMPESAVITSMAVKDDLMAGESYFIREIRYLKRILDNLDEKRMTICAIDEILRGTNTGERIRASKAILEYMADKNCIALIATHDKELTELLESDYLNYHFSEEIGENDICFSYKIMEGPSTSQNAVKLLEFAGFPEAIIKSAQEGNR